MKTTFFTTPILFTLATGFVLPRQGSGIGDWANVKCTDPSIQTITNDPADTWAKTYSTSAWQDMVGNFTANNKGLTLSNFAFDFFHAKPSPACDQIENSNCDVTINCGEANTPNPPVNSPAGYARNADLPTLVIPVNVL
jgi:hypothetical protein